MTSYIIVGKNKKTRNIHVLKFCQEKTVDPIDISLIEKDTTTKQVSQSIGIEDIKNIQKKIFFKAIKSQDKAVIIEDAELLTTEAQNALLKVLEEPPEHTFIILSTETRETILPTILSRCQIIILDEDAKALTEKDRTALIEFLKNLSTLSIGDKLKKAEVLAKEKDKAILWTERVILLLREQLLQNNAIELAKTIRTFQSLHTVLKTTNVNPRLAIEDTLISL